MSITDILKQQKEDFPETLGKFFFDIDKAVSPNKAAEAVEDILKSMGDLSAWNSFVQAMKVAAYRIDLPTYEPRNLSKLPETLYHCRQHFVEVAYNARALLEVNKPHYQNLLSPQHDMELLFAALLHDVLHDGTTNGDTPFRLEKISADIAHGIARSCGVSEDSAERIHTIIMLTDVSKASNGGRDFLRQAHDYHFSGGIKPDIDAVVDGNPRWTTEQKTVFNKILRDKSLCLQACLMEDADLLSSTGLDLQVAAQNELRLAYESGNPTSVGRKMGFMVGFFKSSITKGGIEVFDPAATKICDLLSRPTPEINALFSPSSP